jgi:hypothetical protein
MPSGPCELWPGCTYEGRPSDVDVRHPKWMILYNYPFWKPPYMSWFVHEKKRYDPIAVKLAYIHHYRLARAFST